MDFTMLQNISRLCQLLAYLDNSDIPGMDIFAGILEPKEITKEPTSRPITDSEQATYLQSTAAPLDPTKYDMILQYLNVTGRRGHYHSHDHTTMDALHPHSLALPPFAKDHGQFHENGRTYSCNSSHAANSVIRFFNRQID